MDTNNNTQQTNTFLKGMNTDISDMLIEDSEYRLAENLRYVTNTESNTGELRLIEGDIKCDLMCNDEELSESIIAATSIRDIIILITKNADGKWSVYNGTLSGSTINCNRVFGPCTTSIGDGYKNKLSLVTRWEDSDNVKLYIADGEHPLMVVNVTKNNGTTIADITNMQNTTLIQPTISAIINGQLKPALVQYSYRLYQTNGVSTNVSPATKPVRVNSYKTEGSNVTGYTQNKYSTMGVRVQIDARNTNFNKIQVYRITYESDEQEPTIELIIDKGIGSGIFTFNDIGQLALSQITLAEYNSIAGINIIPKVIESKNDYLFAANIKYQITDFDDWDARAYTSGDTYNGEQIININDPNNVPFIDYDQIPLDAQIENTNLDFSEQYDISKWRLNPQVIGGRGSNIIWQIISNVDVNIDNTPDKPYVTQTENTVNPINYNKSLWHDEIYRYGIVLYDEYMNASPVKWICDIRTTPQYNDDLGGTNVKKIIGIRFTVSNLPEKCKKFEIVRCNRTDLDKHIIAQGVLGRTMEVQTYSGTGGLSQEFICPSMFLSTSDVRYYGTDSPTISAKPDDSLFQLYSPEISYNKDSVNNIIKSYNCTLEVLSYVTAYNTQGYYSSSALYSPCIPGDEYDDNSTNQKRHNILGMYKDQTDGFRYYSTDALSRSSQWQINENNNNLPLNWLSSTGYIKLYNSLQIPSGYTIRYTINEHKIPEVPQWNEFINGQSIVYRDKDTAIGSKVYNPWINPIASRFQDSTILSSLQYDQDKNTDDYNMSPIAISGKSMIVSLTKIGSGNDILHALLSEALYSRGDAPNNLNSKNDLGAVVCNIVKDVTPYGGFTTYDRTNSIYYGHGQVFDVTSDENTIDVFDGDCFVRSFEFVHAHKWYNAVYPHSPKIAIIYAIPIETSIDIEMDCGDRYSRLYRNSIDQERRSFVQDQPANVADIHVQEKPLYIYNNGYSQNIISRSFTGIDEEQKQDVNYDYRVHYSQLKTNNEQIDNWTIFKSADYLDVDTRYGQITDLRLFNNQLLYWQDNAFGILSVNERTLLQDINDTNIMLGTGDVLQRYDHISTEYGMRPNQYADVQSNTTLYWWDGYKKELLAYGGGNSGVLPLSKVKNVRNYINERNETSHPTLAYDYKYNEIMFNVVNDGALTYNENIQAFASVYPETQFYDKAQLRNNLLLIGESGVYKWNETNESGTMSFNKAVYPMLKYVVNKASTEVKVFDNVRFGGRFYGGDFQDKENVDDLKKLKFKFNTPLKQHSELEGKDITNREYDFRFAIPRHDNSEYGGRMRGKTMQCELSSDSNSLDFSLQYITTKFRISWS